MGSQRFGHDWTTKHTCRSLIQPLLQWVQRTLSIEMHLLSNLASKLLYCIFVLYYIVYLNVAKRVDLKVLITRKKELTMWGDGC